jgi:hypothetical protein
MFTMSTAQDRAVLYIIFQKLHREYLHAIEDDTVSSAETERIVLARLAAYEQWLYS